MQAKNLTQTLRQNGVKVSVKHFRYAYKDGIYGLYHITNLNHKDFYNIQTRGGETHVRLTFPNHIDHEAVSICSKSDAFCKRTGVAIAVDRINKEIREYRNDRITFEKAGLIKKEV